jgi:hypothetical protein
VTIVAERLTYVTPLGLAFVDAPTGRRVNDGLVVRVDGARRRPNRIGVFYVPHIAGLAALERGEGDERYWAETHAVRTVRVEVDDPFGRYLPLAFDADVPHRYALTVELYSAPTRLVPAGLAVVRAELAFADGTPAAWALLEVTAHGLPVVRGMADARGRATVLLPYPEPVGLDGSPPSLERRALTDQSWPVEIRAFAGPPQPRPPERPHLSIVRTQPPATLLAGSPPATPVVETTLEYGRELVVRSPSQSTLVLTAAP